MSCKGIKCMGNKRKTAAFISTRNTCVVTGDNQLASKIEDTSKHKNHKFLVVGSVNYVSNTKYICKSISRYKYKILFIKYFKYKLESVLCGDGNQRWLERQSFSGWHPTTGPTVVWSITEILFHVFIWWRIVQINTKKTLPVLSNM